MMKKEKGEKKVKLAPGEKKPKKAMTPFMAFSKVTRKKLVAMNPKLTFSEIGKQLGALWRAMSEEEKTPYVEKASEDYERFLNEQEDYINVTQNGKRRRTAEELQNTKVKKSISAYLYFCNAHRKQVKARHPEMKMVEIQRMLADKWKTSPKCVKLPFEKQAEADRLKYNSELADFPDPSRESPTSLSDNQSITKSSSNKQSLQKRPKIESNFNAEDLSLDMLGDFALDAFGEDNDFDPSQNFDFFEPLPFDDLVDVRKTSIESSDIFNSFWKS